MNSLLTDSRASQLHLPDIVGQGYGTFWRFKGRYRVCKGSRASKKSKTTALWYIVNLMKYPQANLLVIRKETQSTENLSELRKQIDECDNNLIQELAKRMRVAREIGTYKKEHDMTILQTGRYNEILEKRGSQGALCGMDAEFIKKVFEAIHEESVRQQMEIINK